MVWAKCGVTWWQGCNHLIHHGCLPGPTLAGSWSQEQELGIKSRYCNADYGHFNSKAKCPKKIAAHCPFWSEQVAGSAVCLSVCLSHVREWFCPISLKPSRWLDWISWIRLQMDLESLPNWVCLSWNIESLFIQVFHISQWVLRYPKYCMFLGSFKKFYWSGPVWWHSG